MRTKICHLIVSFICIMGVADGYGQQVGHGADITLSQITDNGNFDWNHSIDMDDSGNFQDSIINEIEGKKVYRYLNQERWINDCLYAFIKWCNIFVPEKRTYKVFRLDSFYGADNYDYRVFGKKSPLHQIIKDNQIIVLIIDGMELCSDTFAFNFVAIIPYKNKLYRYNVEYNYQYNFDYENLKNNDKYKISKEIGNFILRYPYLFLNSEGDVNGTFISRYFKWTYSGSDYRSLDEITPPAEGWPSSFYDIWKLPQK